MDYREDQRYYNDYIRESIIQEKNYSTFYKGRLEYDDKFIYGERNRKGKDFDVDERILFEGEYLKEKRWNGSFLSYNYDGPKIEIEYLYLKWKNN